MHPFARRSFVHRVFSFLPALLALGAGLLSPLGVQAEGAVDGRWQGSIEVPGSPLAIELNFSTAEGGELEGWISIPAQGAKEVPLEILEHEGSAVKFRIPGVPGEPTFEGTLAGDGATLSGPFRQGGGETTFSVARADDAAPLEAPKPESGPMNVDPQLFEGNWAGAIEVPGRPLGIELSITASSDSGLEGTITIPVQALEDVPLAFLSGEGRSIRFHIPGIPGDPTFEGTLSEDGASLSGPFTQGGGPLSFSVERTEAVEAARAQQVDEALAGLDEVLEQAVEDFNLPGLGLAVVFQGELVYAEGFGYRDVEAELPMTADTLFAIGSTTKAMTSTVLGMQVDEGLLDWDQPLVELMPAFRLSDPAITARISPRDLVSHRSGLPRHDFLWYNNNELSRAELIQRFPHLELTADLRERFQYNNLMYLTAGYLSGQLDGGSWEESVRSRLFEPLGMERSNFSVENSQQDENFAQPYREGDEGELELIPFRNLNVAGPAGSVNSSVREMGRWLLFNLNEGEVDGEALIQPATLADIQAPHMSNGVGGEHVQQSAYGLGWGVEVYRGQRRLRHGGGIDGFITSVHLYPEAELGLVAFDNRGSGLADAVAQTAADRFLGLEAIDWIGEALETRQEQEAIADEAEAALDATRVADTAPTHPLADYAGTYHDPGYGDLVVSAQGDRLAWTFNDIVTPLDHWHYDVFVGSEEAVDPAFEITKLQFRRHRDGYVAEVVVPLELIGSPIVFHKQADPRLSDAEYLQRYSGQYRGETGQVATFSVSGSLLVLSLPGQPLYTLLPQPSGDFHIENLQGFRVSFDSFDDSGQPGIARFIQPNGVFESKRVEE
ncbi:MAG: serine hydrolase [Acidobacteriota bacterium]